MQFRTVPKNGDALSILGFGCMRLPMKDASIDEPRAISQIRYAIDGGVNYLDTAWPYHAGQSEPLLGKALRDGYRNKVKIATKLPSWIIESRADMDRFLTAQLAKLGTDHIDYYLVHSLDGRSWDRVAEHGIAEFLDRAKADGRIVNAGFSFHGMAPDFQRIVDAYPWVFCQIQYNFLDEDFQAGTRGLEYAAAQCLAVIVMEPLRGGMLASIVPPAVDAIWREAEVRRTPAEWALRWIWNRPEVTVVLSGMNDESQIRENLATADTATANSLNPEELARVRRVAQTYRDSMKVACTGCGYCMPCPSDVAIPHCFEFYNRMHMTGASDEAKFIYALVTSGSLSDGRPGHASQCVQCGTCLDRCPQGIPIPDVLAKVSEEMEGPEMPSRIAQALKVFKVKPN